MRLNTPSFWYKTEKPQHIANMLAPFSCFYAAGHKLHQALATPYCSPVPVLCIGNLVTGGSGKTPTALSVLELIKEERLATAPCFLTRGYGGRLKGPLLVNTEEHDVIAIGDEPFLLAKAAPTIVSADRKAGAKMAESKAMDFIIMDDGFQNPGLHKMISLLVIDAATGFGNHRLLPSGPLREPLEDGLKKADAFVLIGEGSQNITALLPPDKPVFKAHIKTPREWIPDTKSSYIAFTGIGRPGKFKTTLEESKIKLAGWHAFPDHHVFTPQDLVKLVGEAREKGARLITTTKDAIRLPKDFSRDHPLDIMPVQLEWDNPGPLKKFLTATLKKNKT